MTTHDNGAYDSLSVWFVEAPGRTVGMSYDPPDPGEYYVPCGIYVAATRGQAKSMLVADHNLDLPDDFLAARTQRLGVPNEREAWPHALPDGTRWWGRIKPFVGQSEGTNAR